MRFLAFPMLPDEPNLKEPLGPNAVAIIVYGGVPPVTVSETVNTCFTGAVLGRAAPTASLPLTVTAGVFVCEGFPPRVDGKGGKGLFLFRAGWVARSVASSMAGLMMLSTTPCAPDDGTGPPPPIRPPPAPAIFADREKSWAAF